MTEQTSNILLHETDQRRVNEANDKFWMVWGRGKGAPHRQHFTFEEAKQESTRLAKQNPNVTYFVLETKFSTAVVPQYTVAERVL